MMKQILFLLLLLPLFADCQDGIFTEFKYTCQDSVERPFIVYTPSDIDKTRPKPLLIYLHGAISSPNLKNDPLAYIKQSKLVHLAEEGGFYLMFCYGQKGATWFDEVGINMVLGEMQQAQQYFNVDSDKLFLSGFSDGGSGVLHFAMTKPSPFAGFIAMNGSLKVASKLGKGGTFPENSNDKPIYIINTTDDMLYPLKEIEPTIAYLRKFNKNIIFKSPVANHEMSYLENDINNSIISFIKNNNKQELERVSWETVTEGNTIFDCLSINKIDTLTPSKEWHQTYQLDVFNAKADFGLKFDYGFQGRGLKVKGFTNEDCTAKRMGVQTGDIILMMEQDTMSSPYSPYYYTAKKSAGDSTSLSLIRNGKELLLTGTFNEGFFYKVFDNKKSAKITADFNNQILKIYTSRITEIQINFNKIKDLKIKKLYINDILQDIKNKKQQIFPIE